MVENALSDERRAYNEEVFRSVADLNFTRLFNPNLDQDDYFWERDLIYWVNEQGFRVSVDTAFHPSRGSLALQMGNGFTATAPMTQRSWEADKDATACVIDTAHGVGFKVKSITFEPDPTFK